MSFALQRPLSLPLSPSLSAHSPFTKTPPLLPALSLCSAFKGGGLVKYNLGVLSAFKWALDANSTLLSKPVYFEDTFCKFEYKF